jgi:hypothetical protein
MHQSTYSTLGLGVLFDKLNQGIQENEQLLIIARTRADAEELYSQRLADITPATNRITGGFDRDDGASARKVEASLTLSFVHHLTYCHRHMKASEWRWKRPARIIGRSLRTYGNLL